MVERSAEKNLELAILKKQIMDLQDAIIKKSVVKKEIIAHKDQQITKIEEEMRFQDEIIENIKIEAKKDLNQNLQYYFG